MLTELLNYDLPAELIAQTPADVRSGSGLLVMERSTGRVTDRRFTDIVEYLNPGDCLVLNNTRVLPARFFAHRTTGAKLEALLIGEHKNQGCHRWEVMLKNARRVKKGQTLILRDREDKNYGNATVIESLSDGRWLLEIQTDAATEEILEKIGFAPLPPYIKRTFDKDLAETDLQRYQTVYAKKTGAVAAPTAGLHFTTELLEKLEEKNVRLACITLHVGLGTFRPVTAENLDDHQMHAETFSLCQKDADLINDCRQKGGRIIAVGTTSIRTLETIEKDRKVTAAEGTTELFIKPGYKFEMVDAMITNFHLPKSTLLALVAAFAGLENILTAYRHAIEQQYRFYSYGDAMFIA